VEKLLTSSERPDRLRLAGALCLVALVSGIALVGGLRLRSWMWDATRPIRFEGDVTNGFHWGLRVNRDGQRLRPDLGGPSDPVTWRQFFAGYLAIYDRQVPYVVFDLRLGSRLDYAPVRLLVMGLWVKHLIAQDPTITTWRDDQTSPLLWLNTGCELASAVLMFLLVRLWVIRWRPEESELRAWGAGMLAALLLWLNPALVLDGHGWPQWDVWCLPFFLGAALCCSLDFWFTAGALVVVGAMLKGQILLAAPVLLLWPVFQGCLLAALRFVLGGATMTAVIAAPWLFPNVTAWIWIACVVAAAVLAYHARRLAAYRFGKWPGMLVAIALVVWPWLRPGDVKWAPVGALLGGAIVAAPRFRSRLKATDLCAALATITLACAGLLFGGSIAWFRVGFTQAADRYRWMTGWSTGNLPAILAGRYRWRIDDVLMTIPRTIVGGPTPLTIEWALKLLFAIAIVLCAIGLARHARLRDVRVLCALAAPWLLSFAILPQMHERYLVWAAAMTVAWASVSVAGFVLHLLISGIAFSQMLDPMITIAGQQHAMPSLSRFFHGLFPEIGWVVLLVAGIYLFLSLAPSGGGERRAVAAASLQIATDEPQEAVETEQIPLPVPEATPA
jgi:hypothetical protein